MREFLKSVKADLTDRHLLPVLCVLGVALAGALAYATLGGAKGETGTAASTTPPVPVGISGIAISAAPESPGQAVAETTSGLAQQRTGFSRDPFAPLPGTQTTTTTTTTTATTKTSSSSTTGSSGSSTAGASSGSSSHGASGSAPSEPSQPAKPTKPAPVYSVAVLFGVAPNGPPPQSSQLTPYENLKPLTPLPSAKQPLVVFRGVTVGGKSATFTLVGEAILHGNAACLPDPSQCQAIDLKPGQAEQLEYQSSNGQTVTYQLQVVSISASKTSKASVARVLRGESSVGRELLRRAGLLSLPGLHYSPSKGVLVFGGGGAAKGVSAYVAGRRRHHKH